MKRCSWCGTDPVYCEYHDREWGVAVHNDKKLFEMLILEGAQAGLSWITILKRREEYRKAFFDFDVNKLARLNMPKYQSQKETLKTKLLEDTGIIRNKLKIESVFINADVFVSIQEEWGGFSKYLWHFTDGKIIKNTIRNKSEVIVNSVLSDVISKDLKKRGMKFVGSTIVYAYLQAVGVVDDHEEGCHKN